MKKYIAKIFSQRKNPKAINLSEVQSILIKPIGDAVGDSILHLRHITQLKKAFPFIKVGVFVSERNQDIYENARVVDTLIKNKMSSYFRQREIWDIYLDFSPSFTTKYIILDAILNPKYLINFGKRKKEYYNLSTVKNYDLSVKVPEFTHFKDYLMFSPFSAYLDNSLSYQIEIPENAKVKVNQFWGGDHKIRILLNPQGSTRELPAEELLLLLDGIENKNVQFLLTNTTGSEQYFSLLPKLDNLSLASKTTLFEYFALVDSADIVVAVDGGGVHIACACNKPLLAFYSNNAHTLKMWSPAPRENIDYLVLIGREHSNNNNGTADFNIEKAINWLNTVIKKMK